MQICNGCWAIDKVSPVAEEIVFLATDERVHLCQSCVERVKGAIPASAAPKKKRSAKSDRST